MMTPTPDPPPAAPLTAEEIAAIREQWTDLYGDRATLCLSRVDWFGVWTTYDALRDRLARAEAEREGLRALMNEWEHQGSTRSIQYRDDLCERWLAALATPTDGAARAGDAAGDGGGAT